MIVQQLSFFEAANVSTPGPDTGQRAQATAEPQRVAESAPAKVGTNDGETSSQWVEVTALLGIAEDRSAAKAIQQLVNRWVIFCIRKCEEFRLERHLTRLTHQFDVPGDPGHPDMIAASLWYREAVCPPDCREAVATAVESPVLAVGELYIPEEWHDLVKFARVLIVAYEDAVCAPSVLVQRSERLGDLTAYVTTSTGRFDAARERVAWSTRTT